MYKQLILRFILALITFSLFSSCLTIHPVVTNKQPTDDGTVATAWLELYLYLIQQTEGFTPPVASRALGYVGITLYESVVPGLPDHRSLVGQLNGLAALPQPKAEQIYYWPSVANRAMAVLAHELFVNTAKDNKELIDSLESQLIARWQSEVDKATLTRSSDYGELLAEAIYEWSLSDGGNRGQLKNFPVDYVPPIGDSLWQPTAPKFQRVPLQPYWGQNRPFVLKVGEECEPPPPLPYSEAKDSVFYQQAFEVYDTVRNLTPEQRTIALFWADDPSRTLTPPGHMMALTTDLLKEINASLALAAETYAKVGIAETDAFIGCWHTKFEYNLVRPITYIQRIIDPSWNTPEVNDPVTTPPFPEYTSGHSVQSGAVATVLTSLFGENFAITDHTQDHRGFLPRSFRSFDELAKEAAISRLYGGIHYRAAIEEGLKQGHCIGEKVLALKFTK